MDLNNNMLNVELSVVKNYYIVTGELSVVLPFLITFSVL